MIGRGSAHDQRWVLVAGGGNGQNKSTLAAVRAAAAAGYRPAVVLAARRSLASASRYCARVVRTPPVTSPEFPRAVEAELATRPHLTVIATSDAALSALGAKLGHVLDKGLLEPAARAVGLPMPPTRAFESAAQLRRCAADLAYPVVVKPNTKRYEAQRFDTAEALIAGVPDDGPVLVQPYCAGDVVAVGGVLHHGRLVAAVHQRALRLWPVDCGGACAAITTQPDYDLERRLVRLLEGYEGIFMAQLIQGQLLDLNPRVYGSLPLAVAAGVNLVRVHLDLLAGASPPAEPARARPGYVYRWLEGDLKHAASCLRRGDLGPVTAVRAVWPRPGDAHGPESLRDPGPLAARLRHLARSHCAELASYTPLTLHSAD